MKPEILFLTFVNRFYQNRRNMISYKNFCFYLFFLMVTIFVGSCAYESDDYYSPPVNPNPVPPNLQIVTLNLDADTVFIYWDEDVVFEFKTDNQQIHGVKFILDGEEYYSKYNNSGSFSFTYLLLSHGIHQLVLEVYTETGSGSLADELGYEQFIFSKEWVVDVNRNIYKELTSYPENGFLKLAWPAYKSPDFVEYRITREGTPLGFEVGRTTNNFFIDSTYVGEGEMYYIEVIRTDEEARCWGTIPVQSGRPFLSFSANKDNEYRLHWTRTKYYNAIEAIEIYNESRYSPRFELIKSVASTGDTVHLITNAQFGDNKEFTIHLKPRYNHYQYSNNPSNFEYASRFYIGYGALDFSDVYPAGETHYLIGNNSENYIHRYSTETFEIEESRQYISSGNTPSGFTNLQVSKNGTYLSAYTFPNRDVYWGPTTDLSINKVTDLKYLTGNNYAPPILLSDVGTALISSINANNVAFYVYDFNEDAIVGSFIKNGNAGLFGYQFSPNGEYIFYLQYEMKLLHFSNGVFTEMPFSQGSATFHEFMADEPEHFVRWESGVFYIKNCADFSTVYQFPLTDDMIVDIDYYQDQLLTYTDGHLYVRSLIDGSLLYDVPYNNDPTYHNKCTLLNNTILHQAGVFYLLK